MRRPNVLLLYTDQQRWDTIGYGGFSYMKTPNLDKLAQSGVLFSNAFCNNPVCMPSRQSMLSGQYPLSIGIGCNGHEMREDVLTIHKVLKPYGYHTANLGKLHFKNHSTRDHREPHPIYGFDELVLSDEPGCYDDAYIKWVEMHDPSQVDKCRVSSPPAVTERRIEKHSRNTHEPYVFEGPEHLTHSAFVADEAIRYIQQHKHEPFFAIAGFYAPHAPLNPPRRFVDMYEPSKLAPPIMNEGENKLGLSEHEWKKVKAYYYAIISHVDDQVGRILNVLEEEGLRDDTLVLFTSDHGEHLGDHGQIQKGPPGFDSCSHVPLILSYPGHTGKGETRHELIEQVDVAPTILDYCGVQSPPVFQGRSFKPLLTGETYQERSSAYLETRMPFVISWRTVRTHTHKYCASNQGDELLFDLEKDPHELRDVHAEKGYIGILGDMRKELIQRWFDAQSQYPLRTGRY